MELFLARKNYLAANYDQLISSYRLMNATGQLGYALRVAYPEGFVKGEE